MKATFFKLITRNQPNILGGSWDGGKYSLKNACPVCGTGAVRLDPIRYPVLNAPMPQPKLPNKVFVTLTFEIIVPADTASKISSICADCVRPLIDSETNCELPYAQLLEQATLPPFNKQQSTGFTKSQHRLEISCPTCQRDGFYDVPKVPLHLVYDSVPQELVKNDILATWECFGKSRLGNTPQTTFFAMPKYILSQRLADFLRPCAGVELDPIQINN